MKPLLKIGSLLILLAIAPYAWIPMVLAKWLNIHNNIVSFQVWSYLVLSILGLISTCIVPFLRGRILRVPLGLMVVTSCVLEIELRHVTGSDVDVQSFQSLLLAGQFAGLAAETYTFDILRGFLLAAAILTGFLIAPSRRLALHPAFALLPLVTLVCTSYTINAWHGRIEEYPSSFSVVPKLVVAATTGHVYVGARDTLSQQPATHRHFNKIVYLIDESIRGDYLQLNNPRLDNTPYLQSISASLANFGLASSYANCSAQSRMGLRSGMRMEDIPDHAQVTLHQPTLWQYAKAAGYKTVYLDAWMAFRPKHSFITYDELRYVDERTQLDVDPWIDGDERAADTLLAELKKPGPEFIFLEKLGVHSPYSPNVPENAPYKPGNPTNRRTGLPAYQVSALEEYAIATWWRVDHFFSRVADALQKPDVFTIYTSDHGQSMYEGGYDASHCTGSNAVRGEGLVPLWVMTGDKAELATYQVAAARFHDRASHEDIFPTLLHEMGFDPATVPGHYKTSLLKVPQDRVRQFFTGNPFATKATLVAIDDAASKTSP